MVGDTLNRTSLWPLTKRRALLVSAEHCGWRTRRSLHTITQHNQPETHAVADQFLLHNRILEDKGAFAVGDLLLKVSLRTLRGFGAQQSTMHGKTVHYLWIGYAEPLLKHSIRYQQQPLTGTVAACGLLMPTGLRHQEFSRSCI